MARFLRKAVFLSCCIIGSLAALDIVPLNPLVKTGDEVVLTCRSSGPLEEADCLWSRNSGVIRLKEGTMFERAGNLERGECGIKFSGIEANQGKWVCTVYENEVQMTGETNVTLSEIPTVSIVNSGAIAGNTLEVQADEETIITCKAEQGRPEPQIRWTVGDMAVDGGEVEVIDKTASGLVSLQSKLIYRFAPEDHKKPIRCIAVIGSIQEPAVATLEVLFPPKADQQESIQYGFVVGQPGSVVANISANPAPTELTWYIGDVEVNGMGGSSSDKHFTTKMVSSEDVVHRAILNISQLTPVDASQVYVLKAKSMIRNELYTTEYRMRLSSEAEPIKDAASVGGGAMGIIIAVVVILVILALLIIARAKGLLCFKSVPVTEPKPSDREPSETESAGQHQLEGEDKPTDEAVKSESKASLASRLRNMYGSIKARTGKNKGEKIESDPEAPKVAEKRDSVIYAELDLREVTRPTIVKDPQNPNTEYAEIIGIVPREEQAAETEKPAEVTNQ